jgi:SAM-dependent methyltransferase
MTKEQEVWNRVADSWTDFVREGQDITRDEMNNPSMFELIGDVRGLKILDLGCGEGYNSRIMAGMVAGSVVGVDVSDELIRFAKEKEEEDGLGIEYRVLDASDMKEAFEAGSFDVVVCFMAIMDIEKYKEVISEVARVLKPSGRFIFNMPHPCFEVRTKDGVLLGGWKYNEGYENDPNKALYYVVDEYFDSDREEQVPWDMERLKEPFVTLSFHRTLTEYSQALYDAGLAISRMLEPKPTEKGMEALPVLKCCLRIPHSLAIETVKS